VVLLAACGGDDGGNATPDARRAIDATREIDAPANGCPGGKTIYLNRAGGRFTHAEKDNAVMNTSIGVDGTQTLAAWPYSEEMAVAEVVRRDGARAIQRDGDRC
jgi:hypothetical protein